MYKGITCLTYAYLYFRNPVKTGLVMAVIVFFSTNISCAIISKTYQGRALPLYMLYIRVAINDTLFIVMSVFLSMCIYKMAKMSAASVVLEAKVRCLVLT